MLQFVRKTNALLWGLSFLTGVYYISVFSPNPMQNTGYIKTNYFQ